MSVTGFKYFAHDWVWHITDVYSLKDALWLDAGDLDYVEEHQTMFDTFEEAIKDQ